MIRKPLLAAGVAGLLALTAACSGGGSGEGGAGALTYLTFETPSLTSTFWNDSIAAAQKEAAGVKINRITAPSTDRDAYAKQLQSSGQFPDLLQSITPSNFVGAGLLKPYDKTWVEANFLLPQGNALKGEVYIPPTNSQIVPQVYYNKELFAKAGIAQPPKNWAEFLDACAKLKAAGVNPIELGGADPFAAGMPLVGIISADILGKNPKWLQDRYADKVKFADANVVTAVGKYRTLVSNGYFDKGALGVKYADSITRFTGGKSAMYPMGSWFLGAVPKDKADSFGSFPWPTDDGSVVVPFVVGGSMAISAKTKDPAGATKFAQAWSLNPANLKLLIETDGAFPMLKEKTLDDYGVTVTQVFKDSYAYVTEQNNKVSAIGWATNDDSLPPGLNDQFYAASQALFTSDDVAGELAKLDGAWKTATQ
ncbi:ABC transporter substrate-binding protein [Plantactinospora soyae]|uniref:Multiple sugar transport system substrate-binding protein/raffinose/stachyose/melibiose transport system substrate-binding protein n=1 Tax=Plantactinospora soyae TaxID=1544732 RepID=A0A927R3H7_9ACTN|nr:extracellular solute-binding protein [Plantactinospora soyae]MBE1491833.1 multiple sugar transport system substrate-binding protein/raffinose/stachyose/melibiose transport system substrate-binding protein [Plantactinospora soyae]